MLGFMQDQRETELKSMKICIAEQLLPFYQWIMGKTGNHFERYKNFFESKLLGLWKELTPLFPHLEKKQQMLIDAAICKRAVDHSMMHF